MKHLKSIFLIFFILINCCYVLFVLTEYKLLESSWFTNYSIFLTKPRSKHIDESMQFTSLKDDQELEEYFFCPYLSPASYDTSFGILNNRIAIVMVIGNSRNFEDYIYAFNTTSCYAKHFRYQMHVINLYYDTDIIDHCDQHDVFFRRHCGVARFMERNIEEIDYVLYIDADMGVVNPCHTIQEYLNLDEKIEMIFYERFFAEEFAAGSYLIRNTKQARNFLNFWADYIHRLPVGNAGSDNSALMQLFMELHFAEKEKQMQCMDIWRKASLDGNMFDFHSCVKNALFLNSTVFVNNTIKIVCKMQHGWVRDAWLTKSQWSPNDFMLHGMKKSLIGTRWQWPFVKNFNMQKCQHRNMFFPNFKHVEVLKVTDEKIQKILIIRKVAVLEKYKNSLTNLNISVNSKIGICT